MAQHLEACDECRSRLEAERIVRARAMSVLAAADSRPTAAPPFADLVARAASIAPTADDATGSTRTRAGSRTSRVGLAWAASIAIAVGAGFLGRELMLQRGHDLPAELDIGRGSIEAPAIVEAEKSMAAPGAEARKLDVSERVDTDLAEVAAPPAAQRADEAFAQVEDQQISGRTRFATRPPSTGTANGHAALGCWRLDPGQEQAGIPARLWLSEDRLPDGALRLETDPDPTRSRSDAPGWQPLGADSVWLSIPPRVFRLASGDDTLAGQAMLSGDPPAMEPSEVRYTKVECGIP
jgi:hypothetical protein